jgi:hypothetical protein
MIVQMLDISTAYIKEETARWLEREGTSGPCPIVVYDKADYGWWVHVPSDWNNQTVPNVPGDLLAVMTYAKAKGCSWVMFDSDGEEVEDLPKYDW